MISFKKDDACVSIALEAIIPHTEKEINREIRKIRARNTLSWKISPFKRITGVYTSEAIKVLETFNINYNHATQYKNKTVDNLLNKAEGKFKYLIFISHPQDFRIHEGIRISHAIAVRRSPETNNFQMLDNGLMTGRYREWINLDERTGENLATWREIMYMLTIEDAFEIID